MSLSSKKTAVNAEVIDILFRLENWHFWFVERRELIITWLENALKKPRLILDVGCGTGLTAQRLASWGHRVVGTDLMRRGLEARKKENPDFLGVRADAVRLPFKTGVFDGVLILDVLEHTDDRAVLSEIRRLLAPNGFALATVPAMPWLWSRHDEMNGHIRRYTGKALLQLFRESRITVLKKSYFQFFLFPLVVAARFLARRWAWAKTGEERPSPLMNNLLGLVTRLEVKAGRRMSWPWGSSLAVLARKSGKSG